MLNDENISEIKTKIGRLSALNEQFLDHIIDSDQLSELKIDSQVNNPYLKAFIPYEINAWPQFISAENINKLEQCVSSVPRLLQKLITSIASNYPEWMTENFYIDADSVRRSFEHNVLGQMFCRFDIIHSEDKFKVLELNISSSLGGWDVRYYDKIVKEQPPVKSFLTDNQSEVFCRDPLNNMVKCLVDTAQSEGMLDTNECFELAVCVNESLFSSPVRDFLHSNLENLAKNADIDMKFNFIYKLDDLGFIDNKVFKDEKKIHGVIFPNRHWSKNSVQFDKELMNAFLSGNLLLPENPASIVMGDKRWLGLLWKMQDSAIFDQHEKELIEEYVPWGESIDTPFSRAEGDIAQPEYLTKNKDNLVLKPGRGSQGEGVILGKETNSASWQAILEDQNRLIGNLVQEFVQPNELLGLGTQGISVFNPILGAFSFGNKYSGVWIRMTEQGDGLVINSAQGAQEAIVYEEVAIAQ